MGAGRSPEAPLLAVRGLRVHRASLLVVDGISLDVLPGECVGLLGLNGAGKSSVLECLAGLVPTSAGSVVLDGVELTGRPPWERCRAGLVLVPSGRRLFKELSVTDNLFVGAHLRKDRAERRRALQTVFDAFPVLADKRYQKAGALSGGQQQMVAIGRGLMADPKVLLLDEPSEGLAPIVVEGVFAVVARLKARGLSILLAEQNATAVDVCDELLLMREGHIAGEQRADATGAQQVREYVFGS